MPYEILNKKFRLAQKNIDREVSHVTSAANELDKCLQKSSTVGEVTTVLNGMVEKLSLLKRKVSKERLLSNMLFAQAITFRLQEKKFKKIEGCTRSVVGCCHNLWAFEANFQLRDNPIMK